ncbi:VOC family protein [Streptomyces gilvosporeus]|uniref:VOC family protein n=1 Tax=Streptomyces gilvosporeus TaxID=553510 RepID=UPI00131AFA82|nr:VOC family protein [Streptomyces gilvosporeus]
MLKRIDHIGVIVDDLFRAKKFLESLGMTLHLEREIPERQVKAAFYDVGDGARIELIEPTSPEARERRLGQGNKARIEHIAVETDDDIDTVIAAVRGLGVDFVAPQPVAIDGNLNAFTRPHTSEGIQFQFVERGAATA